MKGLRVLVTGSRDWEDHLVRARIWLDLLELADYCRGRMLMLTLVQGECWAGADQVVKNFVMNELATRAFGVPRLEGYPAQRFGSWPSCGPRRNQHMVNLGADLCLAYPRGESRGARGCAKMAQAAGIPTLTTEWPGPAVLPDLGVRLREAGIDVLEGK